MSFYAKRIDRLLTEIARLRLNSHDTIAVAFSHDFDYPFLQTNAFTLRTLKRRGRVFGCQE